MTDREISTCPSCQKYDKFTIFGSQDHRYWRCDRCGYIIYRRQPTLLQKIQSWIKRGN